MMKATLAGHPLHPQLIGMPVALFPTSLALDFFAYFTKNKSYRDAAYYTMLGGYTGAMSAAMAGLVDYFAIPTGTHTKKIANGHLMLNVSSLSLFGLSLAFRRGQRQARPKALPLLLSIAGNVGVGISSWLGGDLVYKHQLRVQGVSAIENARDLKIPGDSKLERLFHRIGELAPGQVSDDGDGHDGQAPAGRRPQRAS